MVSEMRNKTPEEFHRCLIENWCRFFGPMQFLVSDQEGAITSEMIGSACDRYSIVRLLGGSTDKHTVTGLVESHMRLIKASALKLKADCEREGLSLTNEMILQEAGMAQNLLLSYNGSTPAQALLGYTPRDFYDPESISTLAHIGTLDTHPDVSECNLRARMHAKENIIKAVVEDRLAIANSMKAQRQDLTEL